MRPASLLPCLLALILAPLLFGIINQVKAFFAGRRGRPLLQLYFDLRKLLSKGVVYSTSTSWVFRTGHLVALAAVLCALVLLPWPGLPALVSFEGDVIVFVYLLGLGRMALVLAALDTGSAFEGMGGSREVTFAALAEPALLLLLLALGHAAQSLSLTTIFMSPNSLTWSHAAPVLILAAVGLFVLLLLENCRIPFDDPNTHLELTMIHEVMVLDHSGPDLGLIEYTATLKYWVQGLLLINVLLYGLAGLNDLGGGSALTFWTAQTFFVLAGLVLMAVATGVVESSMARLRLTTVPRLIAVTMGCAVLAVILVWR